MKLLVPAAAAALIAGGLAAAPAAAAPRVHAAAGDAAAHVTLIDHRDSRQRHWRGERHDRRWDRGRDGHRHRYAPPPRYVAPRYSPPRYVYAPPPAWYPDAGYYPYSSFSYRAPGLSLWFGY